MIFGVLAFCAFVGWGALRMLKSAERAENEPKYRRRNLLVMGVIYAFGGINGIINVALGDAPAWALCLLPIPVLIAWAFFRRASRIKNPAA
jgi:hypothetical protein